MSESIAKLPPEKGPTRGQVDMRQVSDGQDGIEFVGATAQHSLQDGFQALLTVDGGDGVAPHD